MAFLPPKSRKWIGFNLTGDLGPFTIYTSRRAGTVWFMKAPPLTPPSVRQLHYRNRFRQAGAAWRIQPQAIRDNWKAAARAAHLYVTGYSLFLWWQIVRHRPTLATIERLSRINLVPDTPLPGPIP